MVPTTLHSLADLGALVHAARVARNLTQAELAARTGLGLRLLSELELGTRDLRTSNLLHVLGRLGFDLQAAPRSAVGAVRAGGTESTERTEPTEPTDAPAKPRRRVRHAAAPGAGARKSRPKSRRGA